MRCPVCGAKPREKCTLSTGKPCVKTHLARSLDAVSTDAENHGRVALRTLMAAATRGLRILFYRS